MGHIIPEILWWAALNTRIANSYCVIYVSTSKEFHVSATQKSTVILSSKWKENFEITSVAAVNIQHGQVRGIIHNSVFLSRFVSFYKNNSFQINTFSEIGSLYSHKLVVICVLRIWMYVRKLSSVSFETHIMSRCHLPLILPDPCKLLECLSPWAIASVNTVLLGIYISLCIFFLVFSLTWVDFTDVIRVYEMHYHF